MNKCKTCVNDNPSVHCVNCGSKFWNYEPIKEVPKCQCCSQSGEIEILWNGRSPNYCPECGRNLKEVI